MKKSNETKRLEEVREKVTEILLDWLAEVYEDHTEEGSNVREMIEENLREISTIVNNHIYDFTFILYRGIIDLAFYRCLYFEDINETLICEYNKTDRHLVITPSYESVCESEW